MLLNKSIKNWLLIVCPVALFLKIFWICIFGLGLNLNYDIYDLLIYIGGYLGIASLMYTIAIKNIVNNNLIILNLILGFIIYINFYFFNVDIISANPASNLILILFPLGLTVFLYKVRTYIKYKDEDSKFYFFLVFLSGCLAISTQSALDIIKIIFPYSYDFAVYKIDAAFNNITIPIYIKFEYLPPIFQTVILTTYSLLSVFLFIVVALFIRERKANRFNIIRVLVVPFGMAFICYSIVPVSGPIYAFTIENFPLNMPALIDLPSGKNFIPPAARNGMPSMHLTGALLIWILTAALERKIYFFIATIFVFFTAIATIVLGEHYLLDLIVAFPFASFIGIMLANPDKFITKNYKTLWVWVLNGSSFVVWMGLLLFSSEWLSQNLWFVRCFSVWSVFIASVLFIKYIKFVWKDNVINETNKININELPIKNQVPKWIIGVFIASGFAGLLYEVVYAKSLAVTFGSTSLASFTVLTTYMSGMALGAWIGGYIADKVKSPLICYAAIEACIGVYAVITPFLFQLIQSIYISSVGEMAADDVYVTFLRVILGVIVLGVPTILMGATLPIMFKYLKQLNIQSDAAISRLYSANVIGAALGSFIAGYFFIPAIGRVGATNLAAVFSLMIALYTIEQLKKQNSKVQEMHNSLEITNQVIVPAIYGIGALLILTIGGGVTLGLEVVSIHMLAVVAGNSVYAFALMLAVFLLGLGLGSVLGKKVLNYIDRTTLIIIAQCGISISIIVTALLWDKIPSYFASFGEMQNYIQLGFWAREILRGAVCALAMLPATLFIGANYPAAMSLAADWLAQGKAKGVGFASALNTLGNIIGVLLVGFLLLPLLGSNKVFLLLAIISSLLALIMFLFSIRVNHKVNTYFTGLLVFTLLMFSIYPKQWNITSLSQGANVYFSPSYWGEVVDHTESIEGGVTSVARSPDGKYMTLLTNGKFQGNNSGETLAQESFALIPLMHNSERKSALAIGFGTGMTARVLYEQGFEVLDVVELSKDIVVMANKYFSDINHDVTSKPNVNLIYTDGRNYLLTQDKKYDLISLEITSIWFAGAANLYNKEFYELSEKRLNENGVIQQWVQLHHMHPVDLVYILNTVRSVYKYVWLYASGGQGIIVASNSDEALKVHRLKYPYNNLSPDQLEKKESLFKESVILSPKGVDKLSYKTDKTLRHLISTDSNLYLEYATPKGNALLGDTLTKNLEFLAKFEN
ncbi:fused MFS/spermidine synthase [Acinetobacter thermotolerans]|uniref:fused MFS/spermidine synthase n=1 Tax=Acinetobacter thermotolerans TaxID=3151487 RepID=UPI00325A7952